VDIYYQSTPHTNTPKLLEKHRAQQAATDDVIAERGTYSARGKDVPQGDGWLPKKPGIMFPVHTLDGEIFHRLRSDNPGRYAKYMQPKGMPNRLDVHPRQHERIREHGGMRFITEGEKKVDAGVSRSLLMVGLSGVWNGQKDKALISDWELLPLEGEKYCITFDSDIADNPNVQMAADRQAHLLQERGAEVFMTLLPPSADGAKQGLDDFFANGGTVKELKLLIRPYSLQTVESVRLTRDEKLRDAMVELERVFWGTEWKGTGGASCRDVFYRLIEASRRHGKRVEGGVRVAKAQGPLALEAKVSTKTLWKALLKLEEMGVLYKDNEGRKSDKAGAFVLRVPSEATRAKVSHYGHTNDSEDKETSGGNEGKATTQLKNLASGDLPLRAPRLRYSQPKYTPRRGLVRGTRNVRQSPKQEPRDRIERLGKIRCAILDVVDAAGGSATIQEIAKVLHHKRPRDIRRRNLPMLEDAGIITVDGDAVTLTDDWLEALADQRELGREIDSTLKATLDDGTHIEIKVEGMETVARRRYILKSKAYHSRGESVKTRMSEASRESLKRSRESKVAGMAAEAEREAAAKKTTEQRKAEVFVRDRLQELGRIRLGLLQDIWRDEGGDARTIPVAVEALGYRVEALPEFDNRRFVFAPSEAEGAA
jgi:hypothetical protein